MNLRPYTLLFSMLIASPSVCFAMDTDPREPQNPAAQTSPLLTLPGEILEHVLTFVVAQDPDAIGNLVRIQEVCKCLARFLSKDEIKLILGLDEQELFSRLNNVLATLDLNKIHLLVNLGALSSDLYKDGIILRAIFKAAQNKDTDYYEKLLQIIPILEKAGGNWKESVLNFGFKSFSFSVTNSTLNYAVTQNRIPIVRLLLEHGIKPTQEAMSMAIRCKHLEITALLMKYGATFTPAMMQEIISLNNPDILQILINYGADVNQVDANNKTPLAYISTTTNPEIAKILLRAGATPQNSDLLCAVLQNNAPFAQLLINYGTDVNAIDRTDLTTSLAYVQTAQMAKILLQAGAQLFVNCGQGSTPFAELIKGAMRTKNPMILVEILKTRYRYQTALAIAVALMNGAPYLSALRTVL